MTLLNVCVSLAVVAAAVVVAQPTKSAFWKGTPFDSSVEEMRSLCAADDPIACLKFKAISFLDTILNRDTFQIADNVEVSRNGYQTNQARSDASLETTVEDYVKSHDVTFQVPMLGASIKLDARNLDNDQVDVKLNFQSGDVQARKSKLKKIFIPILVFVLLKAITLVPLALGVLGLKAWNALQLSFFSFVVAVGLAVFQLCKKIAADNTHPQIAAHAPWEPAYASNYIARAFEGVVNGAPDLAYSAHVPQ